MIDTGYIIYSSNGYYWTGKGFSKDIEKAKHYQTKKTTVSQITRLRKGAIIQISVTPDKPPKLDCEFAFILKQKQSKPKKITQGSLFYV